MRPFFHRNTFGSVVFGAGTSSTWTSPPGSGEEGLNVLTREELRAICGECRTKEEIVEASEQDERGPRQRNGRPTFTYREREAKRRAAETPVLLFVLAYVAVCVASAVGSIMVGAIWPTRCEVGVTAWGDPHDGLKAGLEIESFYEEAGMMLCRLHLQNTVGETVTVDRTPMRRAGVDIRRGGLVIPDERHFLDQPRPSLTRLGPGKGTFDQEFVSLRRLALSGRAALAMSWVYENDRSEHTRKWWVGREQRTEVTEGILHVPKRWVSREQRMEVIEGIWTGEIRSGSVRVVAGKPWYSVIVRYAMPFAVLYGLVKGWDRLRRFVARKRSGSEPEEASTGEA